MRTGNTLRIKTPLTLIFISGLGLLFSSSVFACNLESGIESFQQNNLGLASSKLNLCLEDTSSLDTAYFYLGLIHRKEKKLDIAEQYLRKALQKKPESLMYALELATTLEWQGKLESAKEIYQEALKRNPKNRAAQLGFARVERWLGNLNSATRQYKGILNLESENLEALNGLAFISMYDKKIRQSRDQFNNILNKYPDNEEAKTGLKQLDEVFRSELQLGKRLTKNPSTQTNLNYLSFKSDRSAKLTLSVEYTDINKKLGNENLETLNLNKDVKRTLTLGAIFKPDNLNTLSISAGKLKMFDTTNQYRYKGELARKLLKNRRIFLGIQPTTANGSITNNLTYAGLVLPIGKDKELQSQLFYASDKIDADGKAISLTAYFYPDDKKWWKVGASYGVSGDISTSILLSEINYNLNKRTGLKGGFKINPETSEREFEIGFRYRFR
jgi:Tfp pilus assembly protein PilF